MPRAIYVILAIIFLKSFALAVLLTYKTVCHVLEQRFAFNVNMDTTLMILTAYPVRLDANIVQTLLLVISVMLDITVTLQPSAILAVPDAKLV